MDSICFDQLARSFVQGSSRRMVLHLAAALGLAAARVPYTVEAKNKKTPTPNAYGCLNVGQKCAGKDAKCCSGICQGKKPKKGKKDNSKCVAHHGGGCPPGANSCMGGISCGTQFGNCYQTTGQASFCGGGAADCNGCTKDVECEPAHGPGAACIACTGGCGPGTGNTFCLKAAV